MAADRRFGLPHPLDGDPPEDPSPRKPGLWEAFKRALGSHPPDSPAFGDPPVRPRPDPPLPVAPRSPTPPRPPATAAPDPSAVTAVTATSSAPTEIAREVPFLEDLPFEPLPAVATEPRGDFPIPAEPAETFGLPEAAAALPGDPSEPAVRGPRLARGLASFSRDNAEREKKYAHLLRDEPGAEGKRPRRPRRRH